MEQTENKELNFDELKQEANELGIKFSNNITAEKLAERIQAFYKAQEDSAPQVAEATQSQGTRSGEVSARVDPKVRMRQVAKELEAKARKTRVVTIIDNDQRVNNVATSCTVNCSNAYFDLGTIILPLNEKVEVREGHLEVLASVKIPQHVKDPNDPAMSRTVMRPRYSIQTVTE